MDNPVYPLEERAIATSAGAASEDVWLDRVDAGWIWLVTSYGVEDDLNALTAARILKEVGGYPFPVEEELGLVAASFYDGTHKLILGEGSRLGCRFVGPTAGDTLLVIAHGVKLPPGTPLTAELLAAVFGGS